MWTLNTHSRTNASSCAPLPSPTIPLPLSYPHCFSRVSDSGSSSSSSSPACVDPLWRALLIRLLNEPTLAHLIRHHFVALGAAALANITTTTVLLPMLLQRPQLPQQLTLLTISGRFARRNRLLTASRAPKLPGNCQHTVVSVVHFELLFTLPFAL